VGRYRAVLFDWRGTLVHIPKPAWHVARALESIARAAGSETVEAIVERVRGALELPEFIEAERVIDLSAEFHRATTMRMFDQAGLDRELAEALYRVEWEPQARPLYPDIPETLGVVRGRGAKIAVVSDIHFDIRPDCIAQGIDTFIDAYVLSYELGIQKPDPRIFVAAMTAIGVEAGEALMVGDTAHTDGGAAAAGIATFILPRPDELAPRGLATGATSRSASPRSWRGSGLSRIWGLSKTAANYRPAPKPEVRCNACRFMFPKLALGAAGVRGVISASYTCDQFAPTRPAPGSAGPPLGTSGA
jgi:HAD superfamily hydrolase (TIGR01493 family)